MGWELKTRFREGGEEWINYDGKQHDEVVIIPGYKTLFGKNTRGKWEVHTDNPKLKSKLFNNEKSAKIYSLKIMNKFPEGWDNK